MGEWETARTSQNFIQVMLSVCPNRAVKCLLARKVGHFHQAKADRLLSVPSESFTVTIQAKVEAAGLS